MTNPITHCRVCATHWTDCDILAEATCATCLARQVERLRALLNCRAGKLLQKGKTFVVVAVDEPYFSFVFDLIRKHEKHHGRWTDDDQRWYDQAIRESFEIEAARAAANGGGDE